MQFLSTHSRRTSMSSSSSPASPSRKSRFLGAVRRSFTIPMWRSGETSVCPHGSQKTLYLPAHLQLNLVDSRESPPSSLYYLEDVSSSTPTVEQIAMGLHLSRTPHIRPKRGAHARSQSYDTGQDILRGRSRPFRDKSKVIPTPKSALKKSPSNSPSPLPNTNHSSSLRSISTSTSATQSTHNDHKLSHSRLRLRVAKIMAPSHGQNHNPSERPKKLVRFSSDTVDRAGLD